MEGSRTKRSTSLPHTLSLDKTVKQIEYIWVFEVSQDSKLCSSTLLFTPLLKLDKCYHDVSSCSL